MLHFQRYMHFVLGTFKGCKQVLRLVLNLLNEYCSTCILTHHDVWHVKLFDQFTIINVVKQGDGLLPILFAIYAYGLLEKLEVGVHWNRALYEQLFFGRACLC